MIVSGRGIEYGFSPLTHPDDFSNQEIKERTREIARSVLEQLPAPGTPEAEALAAQLAKEGNWHFRQKQRLDPNQSEFPSLDAWLTFVRSDEGVRNAGGELHDMHWLVRSMGLISVTRSARWLASSAL